MSIPLPVTAEKVEEAAKMFQKDVRGAVIIRSGAMGAYLLDKSDVIGTWVEAFWTERTATEL